MGLCTDAQSSQMSVIQSDNPVWEPTKIKKYWETTLLLKNIENYKSEEGKEKRIWRNIILG